MAWSLESQRQALYPVPLLGGAPRRGHPLPKPRAQAGCTVSPSLAIASLSTGSPTALHPQASQVDVSISGTSVDTSVGNASLWGGT